MEYTPLFSAEVINAIIYIAAVIMALVAGLVFLGIPAGSDAGEVAEGADKVGIGLEACLPTCE